MTTNKFGNEYCKLSVKEDYKNLINNLVNLPKELKFTDYLLTKALEDYQTLQEEFLFKYESTNNNREYESFLSVTFDKRKDMFLNKEFLFKELDSLNFKYNAHLDSCFYKLYAKLVILSGDSSDMEKAGQYFKYVDALQEIPEESFELKDNKFGKEKEAMTLRKKSIGILFSDFLNSTLYNSKK